MKLIRVRTLDEATRAFLEYSPFSVRGSYTLERMQNLMHHLGDPQNKLKVIHVAGTSGKTSTAYFIRNMLEEAGARTGLTVSPHIVALNERVQIGGLPLPESEFIAYVNRFFSLIANTNLTPTYFELLVALAYWVFVEEKVDYAIIETGLGGLLDGTNVVTRPDKVCVITDIGFDHTEILGETLAEIATQKAGIIQQSNRVVMHVQPTEVMRTIEDMAHNKQAWLTVAAVDQPGVKSWIRLPPFQYRNWTLAATTYRVLMIGDKLPTLTAAQQMRASRGTPPGRWEIYKYQGKTILLDGAHNPQKLLALRDSLEAFGTHSAAVLINFAQAPEKKITDALAVLKPLASTLIIPEFSVGQDLKGRHSVASSQLAEHAKAQGFRNVIAEPALEKALARLLDSQEQLLLITGSLYLVSQIRFYVRVLPND